MVLTSVPVLTWVQAFLLFENFSRAQWPSKISEARGAYIALKEHFLKYIEHPDDLQSSIDPLADDEQVCNVKYMVESTNVVSLHGKLYEKMSR
jgi:hypothetical protein